MNKITEYKGKIEMYIDGNWTESVTGEKREILYPCTGEVITEVVEGNAEDVRLAVTAARRAFDEGPWPGTPAAERGRLVEKLADKVEENHEELARLESLDTGKTVEESRWDMDDIAGIFRYFGQLADKEGGGIIQSPVPNTTSRLYHRNETQRNHTLYHYSDHRAGRRGGLSEGRHQPRSGSRQHRRD